MEEKNISQEKKKLPNWLTTVTPFSKTLAMILFIVFPFVGFYLGIKYQQVLTVGSSISSQVLIPTPSISESPSSYLELKEMVFKLNKTALPELKFKYKKNNEGDDTAILYTEELSKYCSPDAPTSPLGVMFALEGHYSELPLPKPGILLKQNDTYFISYRSSNQVCTDNPEGMKLLNMQSQKVNSIFSTFNTDSK